MCFNNMTCLKDFEFFTVQGLTTEIYSDEIGGELGLGFDLPENGLSFVSALKAQGIISKEVITVHIDTGNKSTDLNLLSQVTFGGFESALIRDPKEG